MAAIAALAQPHLKNWLIGWFMVVQASKAHKHFRSIAYISHHLTMPQKSSMKD
jgi:hypothetical protein